MMNFTYCYRVSQFVGAADTVLADSITGLIDQFDRMGDSSSQTLSSHQYYDDFVPSEPEYYSYSELPRAAY